MSLIADRLNHCLVTPTLRRLGSVAVRALVVAAIAVPAGVQPLLLSAQPAQAQSVRGSALPSVADLAEQVMEAVVNISAQTTTETRNRTMPNVPGLGPDTPFGDLFEEFFNRRREGQPGQPGAPGQPPRQGENQAPGTPRQQPEQRRGQSAGSGFVIDPSGIVITNNHVIGESNDITVIFSDGRRLKAEVVGKDPKVDLAVLRVKSDTPLKSVKFGDSDKARIGDWVMAIGNPFGLGGSVSIGIVSAKNRRIESGPYDSYLQTDAAINRGNSGGPLFNMAGEVIGINTAILSPSGGSVGIGFSVPSALAMPVIDQLRQFGETRRGWLGVRIQNVDDATAEALGMGRARGALIAGIDDKGPARPAGLETGDVITQFDGKDVKESSDLPRIVAATPVGKEVDVRIMRKGKEEIRKVTLGRLEDGERQQQAALGNQPNQPSAPPATTSVLGMDLTAVTDQVRRRFNLKDGVKGVVVTRVDPNSNAADKRLAAGDIILEVGQEPVASPADVSRRVDQLKKDGRRAALLQVQNAAGDVRFVAVAIN
ncbi:MAG: DegQ family serine endoprotease [Hyphomicrobiales bacterium]|nr:DegQ family serine endoprotease [Hyphomicrobiales bacterium]